jgi:hypothetical protein
VTSTGCLKSQQPEVRRKKSEGRSGESTQISSDFFDQTSEFPLQKGGAPAQIEEAKEKMAKRLTQMVACAG